MAGDGGPIMKLFRLLSLSETVVLTTVLTVGLFAGASSRAELTSMEELGKSIFFDANLSINRNQSCATCHGPAWGFSGPLPAINEAGSVYEGSVLGRFGNRKPPSAAYATVSPTLFLMHEKGSDGSTTEALFVGGNFFDGRATGEKLGNPAADQAQGPFLERVEQGLPDSACVVFRVCNASYSTSYEEVFGPAGCDRAWHEGVDSACAIEGTRVSLSSEGRHTADKAYDSIALAIASYEGSAEVNALTSKYDAYLRVDAALTEAEQQGLELFKDKGRCSDCHVLDEGPAGEPPLLTDFTYDNLGTPRNPDNPWYASPLNTEGIDWTDQGLGGFLQARAEYAQYAAENMGKHKVPTLRNVASRPTAGDTKAYMHNGYFKSLKTVVHFYNTRDLKPACSDPFTREADALADNCWPAPEVKDNVNTDELGDLGMSDAEEDAIVAFMETLSDGYKP